MQTFTMWANFNSATKIKICDVDCNIRTIFHSILRQKKPLPKFGQMMKRKYTVDEIDPRIKHLVVNNPHPLCYAGYAVPVQMMPSLRVFEPEIFEE